MAFIVGSKTNRHLVLGWFSAAPVILEALKTARSTFRESGPFTNKLFENTVTSVFSQNLLPSGTFLIGCRSREQQKAIKIQCSRPEASTEGVIKTIPCRVV